MLFEDPSRRYPHLVQALNLLSRRTPPAHPGAVSGGMIAGAGFVLFGIGALLGTGVLMFLGACFLSSSLIYWSARRRGAARRPAIDPRQAEATSVAKSMSEMLSKRRLHRDIDQGSLTLLDECARHWARARAALEAPFWTGGTVPLHYQAVRNQALVALDEAMDEVLIHYRAWVPDEVQNRHALDYVDEALEQFSPKGGRRRANFIPPQFVPVREIAEKLRSLADEAESMAREVRVDPEVAAQFAPGRSLDQTLSELRQIREAEEELKQNLRG